jgi:hypothetical protein
VRSHDLEMSSRLRGKAAVRDQFEETIIGPVDEHLHARAIRVSDRDRGVEDLFVQRNVVLVDQLRADGLQEPGVGQLRLEPLLVDAAAAAVRWRCSRSAADCRSIVRHGPR